MRLLCRVREETKPMRRDDGNEISREEPIPEAMTMEVMPPSQVCATRSLEEKAPITVPTVVRRLLATAICVLVVDNAPATAQVLDLEKLDGQTAIKMMEEGTLTSVALTQAYIDRIKALNKRGPGLN